MPWVAAGFDRQGQSNLTSNGKLTIRKACASVGSLGLLVIHYCHMMLRSRLQWKGHYSGSASQRNIVTILIIHKMQFRRARARYFILQNCTDASLNGDLPTDPKRIQGQGFGIGSTGELADQASFGGVRLPGRAFPVEGTKHVNVSHDLRKLLRPGDRIRIGSSLCRLHKTHPGAVDRNSLQLRFCWVKPDIGATGLCLYRLPPQGQAGKIWTMIGRIMYENQLTQILIKGYCGFHFKVCEYQRVWAKRLHHRLPKVASQLQKWSAQHEGIQQRVQWWTMDWQQVLESRRRKADRS